MQMSKQLIQFVIMIALSSLVLAQDRTQLGNPASPDSTTACDVTFSSGSSTNATQFCVTANGNIAQFSVAGGEMIAVGGIGEGYGICDVTSGVGYFDYADGASLNWGTATLTHSGNLVTVVRKTSDGLWQLTQKITNVPATATAPGSAKVSMGLKNLSSESRQAYIMRYADVDADGDQTGNDFDYTSQSAFGLEPSQRGLGITNNTFNINFGYDTYAQLQQSGPNPCLPFALIAPHPFHGDGSIAQFWSMTVNKGATQTVVSTYKPI